MSLRQPRYAWLVEKLTHTFVIDSAIAEKCCKDNKKRILAFFQDPSSPPKLFFFYQPRQFKHPELYLSLGKIITNE